MTPCCRETEARAAASGPWPGFRPRPGDNFRLRVGSPAELGSKGPPAPPPRDPRSPGRGGARTAPRPLPAARASPRPRAPASRPWPAAWRRAPRTSSWRWARRWRCALRGGGRAPGWSALGPRDASGAGPGSARRRPDTHARVRMRPAPGSPSAASRLASSFPAAESRELHPHAAGWGGTERDGSLQSPGVPIPGVAPSRDCLQAAGRPGRGLTAELGCVDGGERPGPSSVRRGLAGGSGPRRQAPDPLGGKGAGGTGAEAAAPGAGLASVALPPRPAARRVEVASCPFQAPGRVGS